MKKTLVLTSLLALCACGGGGGGSGVGPTNIRAAVDQTAIDSNLNITSMASEVLVPTDSSNPIVARSGTVKYDGKTYTSYRLDDVDFRVATGGGNDALLNFKMDSKGKIDSLVLDVGGGKQKMFRRDDNSADFRGVVYEYIVLDNSATGHDDYAASDRDTLVRLVYSAENDPTSYETLSAAAAGKCPAGKYCRWDRIDQAFRITSKGGTDSLTYSDFGMLQTANFGKWKGVTEANFADAKTHSRDKNNVVTDAATWDNITFDDDDFDVFGGGYKVSALSHRPTETMDFVGKAVGSVYATNSDNHQGATTALEDNAAELHFENGTSTLVMDFEDWYTVTVTQNSNGSNRIQFTGSHANENDNGNAFRSSDSLDVTNFTTTRGDADSDGHVKTEGMLDMGYYGVSGPEEATGVVRFKETANEAGVQYEREFRAGYGLKPTTH